MNDQMREVLVEGLSSRGHLKNVRFLEPRIEGSGAESAVIQGETEVNGRILVLRLEFDRFFPSTLPVVAVNNHEELGLLPHLMLNGEVCYRRRDAVILARAAPLDIAAQALTLAKDVLERGLSGENASEYVDEWDTFWGRLPNCMLSVARVAPGQPSRRLYTAMGFGGVLPLRIVDSREQIPDADLLHPGAVRWNGVLIPLIEGTLLRPPNPSVAPDRHWYRQVFLENTSEDCRRNVNRLINQWNGDELVVFSLPRPSGGAVIFGGLFKGVSTAHPLRQDGRSTMIVPVSVLRMDDEYLLPRSGADTLLQSRRVAVLGCGSVGSMIAVELVRAGVNRLVLVDRDILLPENTFRHYLGRSAVGLNKAFALRLDLFHRYHATAVEHHAEDIFKLLTDASFQWQSLDAIVVATGDASLELHLNELFHGAKAPGLVVYSWVEPHGIGGHALLTRPGRSGAGCLECLHTDPKNNGLSPNRAAFCDPYAAVDLDLAGCGGQFTPYGGLHATRTATMTTQLLLDGFRDEVAGCPVVSWRGSAKRLTDHGFDTTDRYLMSDDERILLSRAFTNPTCRICGPK